MPHESPNSQKLIGLEAELQFKTQTSSVYELYRRHNSRELSLKGWVIIHYPCEGEHQLCILACLDPKLTKFTSSNHFGGNPSRTTRKLIERLLTDVRALVGASDDCTWHIGLQDRGIGTYECDPPIGI